MDQRWGLSTDKWRRYNTQHKDVPVPVISRTVLLLNGGSLKLSMVPSEPLASTQRPARLDENISDAMLRGHHEACGACAVWTLFWRFVIIFMVISHTIRSSRFH